MINPLRTSTLIDSCAFDSKYAPEDSAAREIFRLHQQHDLGLTIAHSTQKEVDHPRTPAWVKREATKLIYTLPVSQTTDEIRKLRRIEQILAGNGKVENVVQDARNVFEAQKYGSYFITTDIRILKRGDLLHREFSLVVVKPSEFLEIVRDGMAESDP